MSTSDDSKNIRLGYRFLMRQTHAPENRPFSECAWTVQINAARHDTSAAKAGAVLGIPERF